MFSNRRNTDLIYTVLYVQNITKRSKSKNGKEVKRNFENQASGRRQICLIITAFSRKYKQPKLEF